MLKNQEWNGERAQVSIYNTPMYLSTLLKDENVPVEGLVYNVAPTELSMVKMIFFHL